MASAYHQGATLPGPPAGGARSRTRRARRATGGRSATASAGGSRVAAGSVREEGGVLCRAGASRDARSPRSPRQSTSAMPARRSAASRMPRHVARTSRFCGHSGRTRSPSSACARASARRRSARRAWEAGEVSERAARRGAATTGVPWFPMARDGRAFNARGGSTRRRAPSGSPSCSGSCSSNTPRSCTIDVGKLGASGAPDDVIIATGRAGGCCATTPRALLSRW